jgi:hypothetical protein
MATRRQIVRQFEREVSLIVGRIASNLVSGLRDQTRRDTSYHASRWVGRAGGPPASRTTPNSRSGRAAALSFAQQNASIAGLRLYRLRQGNLFIGNDGDYIEELNRQDGFVPRVVNRVTRSVSLQGTTLR